MTTTIARVRAFCNMGTTLPTDATITQWIADNLALIDQFYSDADEDIKGVIINNRISKTYVDIKKQGNLTNVQQNSFAQFLPLSADEKTLLSGYETNVDEISMNGKRSSEIFGGRR